MKTLDDQYLEAKREYEAALAKAIKGRSIAAAISRERMKQLAHRILRRDSRKRRAA